MDNKILAEMIKEFIPKLINNDFTKTNDSAYDTCNPVRRGKYG